MAYETGPAPRDDGRGGIYALLVVIVILIVGAVLYFAGVFGTRDGTLPNQIDVQIEAPDITPSPQPQPQPQPPGN